MSVGTMQGLGTKHMAEVASPSLVIQLEGTEYGPISVTVRPVIIHMQMFFFGGGGRGRGWSFFVIQIKISSSQNFSLVRESFCAPRERVNMEVPTFYIVIAGPIFEPENPMRLELTI
jgi:hypothetical protein